MLPLSETPSCEFLKKQAPIVSKRVTPSPVFSPKTLPKYITAYASQSLENQLQALQKISGNQEAFNKAYPGKTPVEQEKSFIKGTGLSFRQAFQNGTFFQGFSKSLKNIEVFEEQLEAMDLSITELTFKKKSALPANISRFKSLKILNLQGCQIFALPACFFELWSLTTLNVDERTVALHTKNFTEEGGLTNLTSFTVHKSLDYYSFASPFPPHLSKIGVTTYSRL